jgi:uncharacterized membrane protein YphA (DoxX/SURF4 family)
MSYFQISTTWPFHEKFFSLWRIAFGTYLSWYSANLLLFADELYSHNGFYAISPFNTYFPSILQWYDPVWVTIAVVLLQLVGALMIAVGWHRPVGAGMYLFAAATLFQRNPFTEGPYMAFIYLVIAMLVIIPSQERWSLDKHRSKHNVTWYMPSYCYLTVLLSLGIGYSLSGLDKFLALGWQTGDALFYMFNGPLTYNIIYVDWLRSLPAPFIALLTWFVGGVMLFCLPAFYFHLTRKYFWLFLTMMFVFVLFVFNIPQVSLGVLLTHFFVFDHRWLPNRVRGWWDQRFASTARL